MPLNIEDPLAHRALDALLAAESSVVRELRSELDRYGLSPRGFAVLVLLTSAGGSLELRTARLRLRTSKANASEVTDTLEAKGCVLRSRSPGDRRAVMLSITRSGEEIVSEIFPRHTGRVRRVFSPLDEDEKRSLTLLCRKLAA